MTNDVKINESLSVPAPKKRRKKIASLDRRKARAGWIFVLPFIIGFVLIYLPMVFQSVQLSFSQIDTQGGQSVLEFVGFQNYSDALLTYTHPEKGTFIEVLVQGLGTLAFDLPAILLFSLFMAVMLNQQMVGRAAFRSIFFVPVIISTGIMESIQALDVNYQNMQSGSIDDGSGELGSGAGEMVSTMDLQTLFANMAVGQELVEYIAVIINNIFNIVNRAGVQMLIFLAALQSISPAIYESCKIDGATAWEIFWKITFPMISPMILVNAVYTVIDSFTVDSNPVMSYVSAVYSGGGDGRTMSTAMSWIYFLIVILVVALIAAVMSAFVFYQRKND